MLEPSEAWSDDADPVPSLVNNVRNSRQYSSSGSNASPEPLALL